MRTLLLLACLAFASAADPLEGLRFLDGREHRLTDWPGQPVLVVHFCGHCPGARKTMNTTIQEVGALIESEKLAAQLICITPDFDGDALRSYVQSVCPKISATALFANDPDNVLEISLNNIFQTSLYENGVRSRPQGRGDFMAATTEIFRASKAYRYPIADLADNAKDAWWMVERGKPGALAAAIKARTKEPAKAIVAGVEQVLVKRQETLLAEPESLDTVEALEALLDQGEGLPALKPSAERLKELRKAPALKDELKARDLYAACTQQMDSKNPKEREAGKANLAKVAQKYPDTAYGKRAASVK